jgi:anti-anti-sigma factor
MEGGAVRLAVSGELDLASSVVLEAYMTQLETEHAYVRLDLSAVEFIDVAGIHALERIVARADGWLRIEPELQSQARRILNLTRTEHLIAAH